MARPAGLVGKDAENRICGVRTVYFFRAGGRDSICQFFRERNAEHVVFDDALAGLFCPAFFSAELQFDGVFR